jgi:UPF0271 protein
MRIDLNGDVGEGFEDALVLPFLSSANVACGAHAGDRGTIREVVRLALLQGVALGAHPSYLDRGGFGREPRDVSGSLLEAQLAGQISAVRAEAERQGGTLRHVKLHGALYHRVSRDEEQADAALRAFRRACPGAVVFAQAGSAFAARARGAGFRVAGEAFADRGYRDGALLPRGEEGALLEEPADVARQAVALARGELGPLPDTLCLHGDHPRAAENARLVREALVGAGIEVLAP